MLGRTLTLHDNTDQEVTRKIAAAWGRFSKLKRLLRAPTSLDHRLRILEACIGQSVMWAAESWHITRRRLQRIRGMELRMLKSMIPPPYYPPDTPEDTLHDLHKQHIRETVTKHNYIGMDRMWVKKCYMWAGHVARLPGNRWASKALREKNVGWWRSQQQLPEGHRHTKRRGNLSRWGKRSCSPPSQARKMA